MSGAVVGRAGTERWRNSKAGRAPAVDNESSCKKLAITVLAVSRTTAKRLPAQQLGAVLAHRSLSARC